MTLQEFVTETLLQITRGVAEAQKGNSNIAPNVEVRPGNSDALLVAGRMSFVAFPVEFDVAVTVTDKTAAEAKGAIAIVQVFSAGGGKSTTLEHSSVSRIKFSVPVNYMFKGDN